MNKKENDVYNYLLSKTDWTTSAEIANHFKISIRTVKTYIN